MAFAVPALPFATDALEPYMSERTVSFHYGRHHLGYCKTLNMLVEHTSCEELTLEELIRKSRSGAIFNNAAQTWNHTFFWNSMKSSGGGAPHASGPLAKAICSTFGSFADFRERFIESAAANFGSGWTWLASSHSAATPLKIINTSNAGCILTESCEPIFVCDVWEHAYYLDYFNARVDYVKAFLDHLVNWEFAEANFDRISDGL